MSKAQREKRRKGYGQAPVQRSVLKIDPVAATALQENIDSARNPQRRYVGNTGKRNSYVDTHTNRTAGVETQISNTPNARRGRQHDIAFRDTGGNGYEQRADKGTPYDRRLRSATVKDQISRGLDAQGGLNSGDRLTANPTSKGRARLYQGIGGQAFEATPDRHGDLMVDSRVTRDGGVINSKGKKVAIPNIKGLRTDLSQMAVKRMIAQVGGPLVQGLMQVDGMLKSATGKGLFEHQHEEKLRTAAAIEGWGPNLGLFK
jgi:hypothetical protein